MKTPSDPQWKGAASDKFLNYAVDRVTARGGRIANLEVGLERHWAGGVLGANLYLRHTQDFVERRAQREGTR